MSGTSTGPNRLSTLAAMIGELDSTSVYGRVTAVRGLLVEVSGPIGLGRRRTRPMKRHATRYEETG